MVEASALMVQALVTQLVPLLKAIEQFEHHIAERFQRHPDRGLFESFPGAGAAVAPRLLVALGVDRQRWQAAEEIQRLSGIAPSHRAERPKPLGPLAVRLSEISETDLSGICELVRQMVSLGQGLLSETTRSRKPAPGGDTRSGL